MTEGEARVAATHKFKKVGKGFSSTQNQKKKRKKMERTLYMTANAHHNAREVCIRSDEIETFGKAGQGLVQNRLQKVTDWMRLRDGTQYRQASAQGASQMRLEPSLQQREVEVEQ